jgi:hypothetical protein
MFEISALLKQIETYCVRHGIEETTFGLRAVNDGKFVARLRGGRTIQLNTYQKVCTFLSLEPVGDAA